MSNHARAHSAGARGVQKVQPYSASHFRVGSEASRIYKKIIISVFLFFYKYVYIYVDLRRMVKTNQKIFWVLKPTLSIAFLKNLFNENLGRKYDNEFFFCLFVCITSSPIA